MEKVSMNKNLRKDINKIDGDNIELKNGEKKIVDKELKDNDPTRLEK